MKTAQAACGRRARFGGVGILPPRGAARVRAASLRPRFGAQVGMGIEPMGQKVKAWQIALFVAAAAVLAVSIAYTFRGSGVEFADKVMLVDVKTGQVFSVDTSKRTIGIPARHPETGERTLYPIRRENGGEWVIEPRALGALVSAGVAAPDVVDPNSGKVIGATSRVRSLSPRDLMSKNSPGVIGG